MLFIKDIKVWNKVAIKLSKISYIFCQFIYRSDSDEEITDIKEIKDLTKDHNEYLGKVAASLPHVLMPCDQGEF